MADTPHESAPLTYTVNVEALTLDDMVLLEELGTPNAERLTFRAMRDFFDRVLIFPEGQNAGSIPRAKRFRVLEEIYRALMAEGNPKES